MHELNDILAQIKPLDKEIVQNVRTLLETKMSNMEGLGELRSVLLSYAGIIGKTEFVPPKKCTIIACGDHGVSAMKVSAYPPETTLHMTKNYLEAKGATANAMANFAKSDMIVVDMGIGVETGSIPGLLNRKIAFGTKNCAKEAAMTREEAVASLLTGISLVEEYSKQGYCCFLPGEMGIANTTASAAIVASICGLSAEKATGRGTNISDERLQLKISVVDQVLRTNQPDPADGIDVLQKVGGFELGCIAGIILGAAAHQSFVVLDGFNTGAAALIASTICPTVKDYLMASHLAAEPAHQAILAKLGLHPYMDMQFRLGEATGSSIIVNLLDAAILAYDALLSDQEETLPSLTVNPKPCIPADFRQIPAPDPEAMEKCQFRIDNLCKPIYSLGRLEQIAVKIAGIRQDSQPDKLKKALLCLHTGNGISSSQAKLSTAFAAHADASLWQAELPNESLAACFSFGAACAAALAEKDIALAGIGGIEILPSDICGSKLKKQQAFFCSPERTPRFTLETFLEQPWRPELAELAAFAGYMLAAASQRQFVILDNASTEIAAQLVLSYAPEAEDYLLHTQTHALFLDMTTSGGCVAALGMKLADASLHMLNDMKTFQEARVAVANDGPGAGRQVSHE